VGQVRFCRWHALQNPFQFAVHGDVTPLDLARGITA
jgi:hypothetical protein